MGENDDDDDGFDLDSFLNERMISLNSISDEEFGDAIALIEQKSIFNLEEIVSKNPEEKISDDALGQISEEDLKDAVLELRQQQLIDLEPLDLIEVAGVDLSSLNATDSELEEAMTRVRDEGNIDLKTFFVNK